MCIRDRSSGASISSKIQNGVGLANIIANKILIAVNAFSPPDSKFRFFIFLPGGLAVIWISLSSILSSSNIVSSPSPPPNSLLYTYLDVYKRQVYPLIAQRK